MVVYGRTVRPVQGYRFRIPGAIRGLPHPLFMILLSSARAPPLFYLPDCRKVPAVLAERGFLVHRSRDQPFGKRILSIPFSNSMRYTALFYPGQGDRASRYRDRTEPDVSSAPVYDGDELRLFPVFGMSADSSGWTYRWFANGELIGESRQLRYQLNDQRVEFLLEITNSLGCTSTATLTVEPEAAGIQFPNAFTPTRTGRTIFFQPVITGNVDILDMLIFDRWGQKVYNHDNPARGWNGYYKGRMMPSDVYIVLVRYQLGNSAVRLYKGDLSLIR